MTASVCLCGAFPSAAFLSRAVREAPPLCYSPVRNHSPFLLSRMPFRRRLLHPFTPSPLPWPAAVCVLAAGVCFSRRSAFDGLAPAFPALVLRPADVLDPGPPAHAL